MASAVTRLPEPLRPLSRGRALFDLELAWASVRAASAYVQQLDDLVVKASVWGDCYANAQALLDASLERLESWQGSPYPAEHKQLVECQRNLWLALRAAQRHVERFEWSKAQGSLYAGGLDLLKVAAIVGVEL